MISRLRYCALACSVAGTLALGGSALASSPFHGTTIPAQTDVVSSGDVVPVTLKCPTGTIAHCVGLLVLKTSKPVAVGSRHEILQLGSHGFLIAPGKTSIVNTKISAEGVKLLKPDGRLVPNAITTSRDGVGHRVVTSRLIHVRNPGLLPAPPPTPTY